MKSGNKSLNLSYIKHIRERHTQSHLKTVIARQIGHCMGVTL